MDSVSQQLLASGAQRGWQYRGTGTRVTPGTNVPFPETAQAGDLAILCGGGQNTGTTPSGWTNLSSGASLSHYKICAGGETSVTWSTGDPSEYVVMLFRPVAAAATLSGSNNTTAGATTSLNYTSLPTLVVIIGSGAFDSGWITSAIPGDYTITNNSGYLLAAYSIKDSGTSTGTINISHGSGTQRLINSCFHLA